MCFLSFLLTRAYSPLCSLTLSSIIFQTTALFLFYSSSKLTPTRTPSQPSRQLTHPRRKCVLFCCKIGEYLILAIHSRESQSFISHFTLHNNRKNRRRTYNKNTKSSDFKSKPLLLLLGVFFFVDSHFPTSRLMFYAWFSISFLCLACSCVHFTSLKWNPTTEPISIFLPNRALSSESTYEKKHTFSSTHFPFTAAAWKLQ